MNIRIHGLPFFLLIFVFLIITSCSTGNKVVTIAKQGVFHLENYDFNREGIVALNGEWEFYWNELLKPEDFLKRTNFVINYFNIPNKWNGYKINNKKISDFGYATYRLHIILNPDKNYLYGMKIRDISSSYIFWLNNLLIVSNGSIASSEKYFQPKWISTTTYFVLTNQTNELILQVANYSHVDSGVLFNIFFGISSKIDNMQRRDSGFEFFLFGALLITGLYHLGLYYFRRKDRSSLFFGIFCLLIGLRTFITGERNLIQIFPDIPWVVTTKIEYLITPLTPIFFLYYLRVLYPHEISKKLAILQQIFSYTYVAIILIFPEKIYSSFFLPYFISVVIFICYLIFCLFKAFYRKRENVIIVMLGFIVLSITVINDFLYTNLIINTTLTIPFGVFIFIFSQSLLLSIRFSKAFSNVEDLSKKLEIYSENLEEIVDSRTRELAVASQQIERDKNLLKFRNEIMENELELAKKIQLKMIPQKSTFSNIAFYYQSMEKVGGDYFDIISYKNPDLIGLFVSDVSGHGIPAAFITSMLKISLNQYCDDNKKPSDILYYLNNTLIGQTDGNFITAFYGIYNQKSREFIYSNAGHFPPFFINNKDIKPLKISNSGIPLAIMKNEELKSMKKNIYNHKVVFEKNSKLLLYTDGLIETVNKKEKELNNNIKDFEESIMYNIMLELRDKPAAEFINGLLERLLLFRGSNDFDDDVCMICMDIK